MNDLAEIVSRESDSIRKQWIAEMSNAIQRADLISRTELEEQCAALLKAIVEGIKISGPTNVSDRGWESKLTAIGSNGIRRRLWIGNNRGAWHCTKKGTDPVLVELAT